MRIDRKCLIPVSLKNNSVGHTLSLLKLVVTSFWGNRNLISALTEREIVGRYRGSFLGIVWSLIHPILMLSVYTFVFSVVLKNKWVGGNGSNSEFALLVFAGLIPFNFFSECISSAPTLILANANYVKKVVFPLEILALVSLLTASFHALVSILVWLIAFSALYGLPNTSILLLPLVFIQLGLFTIGLTWFLSALGVYIKDVAQVINIALAASMFLSPIFYSVQSLPIGLQNLMSLNPLAFPIEQIRLILFWGSTPPLGKSIIYWIISVLVFLAGYMFFQKTRKGFADVI